MSSKSKRLGSLADVFKSESLDGTVRKIRMEKILPSERQPRQERKKGVEELALSLKAEGLLQPIVVARSSEEEDSYRIIAGERRFHAATSLGWNEIECKIFDRDEKETYKLAIIENLQREDLSPYEEVDALIHLKKEYKYTDQELAEMFGKSRSYMTEILSITHLSAKAMQTCKDLSINNKNLLVQAVQAEKRGNLQEFFDLYKNGELKTVRDAKEFNKKDSQDYEGNGKKGFDSVSNHPAEKSDNQKEKNPVKIVKKPDSIEISCTDPLLLMEIYKFTKKEIPKRFP
ncbi:MAG: ParB/RepB/Spo0J family partition protein [Leptospira sp.]|nr:ParB/RepB/Spo0J family partition protein [Leptospira sp.]